MTNKEKRRDDFAKSLRRAVVMMEYYHYFSARETNAELLKEKLAHHRKRKT